MCEVPKEWKDVSGFKRHTLHEMKDDSTDLVVSKRWNTGKQSWSYLAETKHNVLFQIKLTSRSD